MNAQIDLQPAFDALASGGTILFPTDTIWGIGCDATNEAACQRIMSIKNRPEHKSFVLLADSWSMIERYVPDFPSICYDLVDLSTRPLTIIYPTSRDLAPTVLGENGTVGIRLVSDPVCKALIRSLRKPIVATSANVSGESFATRFSEIPTTITQAVNAIVQHRLEEVCNTPSQIIQIGLDSSVKVIR